MSDPRARFQPRRTIVFQQTLGVALLVTATVGIQSFAVEQLAGGQLEAMIRERLAALADSRAALIESYVDRQHERAVLVASRTRLRRYLEDRQSGLVEAATFREGTQHILADAQRTTGDFIDIWIADTRGMVITAIDPSHVGRDVSTEPAFARGGKSPYLGEPRRLKDHTVAYLAAPARTNAGELVGVVLVLLRAQRLSSLLNDRRGLGVTGEIAVARRDGSSFRYLNPARQRQHDASPDAAEHDRPSMAAAVAGKRGFQRARYLGRDVVSVYRPVRYQRETPWGLVVHMDRDEVYAPIWSLRQSIVLPFLLVSIGGVLLAYFYTRHWSRPLRQLTDTTTRIASGDLTVRVARPRTHDEVGVLALAFNDMAEHLDDLYASLEKRVKTRTAQLAERTGELENANEELERSNMELQQFAYVASHDLQEPLRTVGSYLTLLSKKYSGALDDDADRWIGYMLNGVNRLQAMIRDLLVYSRVESRASPFVQVDSSEVLKHVLADLHASIEESGASVTHEALPTVLADQSQLAHVMQNLLGNAIKYRGETPPKIHIAATRVKDDDNDAHWQFSIADNGIGIEPDHHAKVFEIFKRLHKREAYPGTGIGLAVCERVIRRHGGRIWVESEAGKGATFHFTLPDQ